MVTSPAQSVAKSVAGAFPATLPGDWVGEAIRSPTPDADCGSRLDARYSTLYVTTTE